MKLLFFVCQLIFLYASSGVISENFVAILQTVHREKQDGSLELLPFLSPGLHETDDNEFVIHNTFFGSHETNEYRFRISFIRTMIENEIVIHTMKADQVLHCTFTDLANAQLFYARYSVESKEPNPIFTALKLVRCVVIYEHPSTPVTEDKVNIFFGSAGGSLRRFFIESAEHENQPFLIFTSGSYGVAKVPNKDRAVIAIKLPPQSIYFLYVLHFDDGNSKNFVAELEKDANRVISSEITEKILNCAAQ